MKTASELRIMAAALETPGDLTPRELEQAHADIIEFLLDEADAKGARSRQMEKIYATRGE